MADMERFSSLLRKYRRERGITQNELAERLMVSPQSVSVWESGKGLPDVDHLCELLCTEKSSVYRRREQALRHFTTALYGRIDS